MPEGFLSDHLVRGLTPGTIVRLGQSAGEDLIVQINESGTTVLLVEQNANMALSIAHHGYVMETGKIVMDKPAAELREDDDVKEFYLGLHGEDGAKNFGRRAGGRHPVDGVVEDHPDLAHDPLGDHVDVDTDRLEDRSGEQEQHPAAERDEHVVDEQLAREPDEIHAGGAVPPVPRGVGDTDDQPQRDRKMEREEGFGVTALCEGIDVRDHGGHPVCFLHPQLGHAVEPGLPRGHGRHNREERDLVDEPGDLGRVHDRPPQLPRRGGNAQELAPILRCVTMDPTNNGARAARRVRGRPSVRSSDRYTTLIPPRPRTDCSR